MTDFRVGIGYDVHRLDDNRPLILGGLEIPFDKGLIGHSDGDVLLHAVTDAVLGACALPDIGDLFPDTDPRYEGANSTALLAEAITKVHRAGFRVVNVDCVIHAERPKLTEHKRALAESIAALVEVDADRVSVKAKTNEGMGPVGTLQAIAATAVATAVKTDQDAS